MSDADERCTALIEMMAHDLRSPLTGVATSLELLRMDAFDVLDSEQREDVLAALVSVRRAVEMLAELVDVGRIERGQLPIETSPFDLGAAAAEAAGRFRPPPEVSVGDRVHAVGDHGLCLRVLTTLIETAQRFSIDAGDVSIHVGLEDGAAVVRIVDTSPAVPAEDLETMFDPRGAIDLRRGHRKYGMGVGLPFCRAAVVAQQGSLERVSGDRGGYRIALPVADSDSY